MSLKEQLLSQLASLSPFHQGEQSIEVTEGGQRLHCQLTALDKLGCAFLRLRLADDRLATMTSDQLRATAELLSARLTYLLEPISPIETDSQGCVVQLRSNPPHKDDNGTTYYELLVTRGGEISLCRYTRAVGQSRQPISAEVTREVLGRLAKDFSVAVA